MSVEQRWNGD